MKTAKVTIRSGMFSKWRFTYHFENMADFKQALLKRFGNLSGTSKSNRYHEKVKTEIRKAESLDEIRAISPGSGWTFEIEVRVV